MNNSKIKVDRDLILLPNHRYRVVAFITIRLELLMRCHDWEFWVKVDPKLWGKNPEKSGNFQKSEKKKYNHIFIIKTHVLEKFREKMMLFDKIRGHLVIFSYYSAQTTDPEGPLRKRAIKFEVEMLDTPNFHRNV